jgi:hypothetical protein
LGNALYEELKNYFPNSWGTLSSDYDHYFKDNFEFGMKKVYSNPKTESRITELVRNMGEYFCKFQPHNDNLYIRFLKELDSLEDIVFSSLNYDTLLELAAEKEKIPVNHFEIRKNELTLFKIHGSSNFLPPSSSQVIGITLIGSGIFDMNIRVSNCEDVKAFCNSNTALSPIMAIYMENKPLQINSSQLDKVKKEWQNQILNAEHILIIGVRPNPDDKHIWDFLSNTQGKIGYVGNKDEFNKWKNAHRNHSRDEPLGDKWKDVFNESINFLD